MPTLKFCRGNCKISGKVRKLAGKGNLEIRRLQGVEVSDVLGREQIHGNGLVSEAGPAASRGLPITAKADVMQAFLPADNIIQVIAPAQNGGRAGTPDREVRTHRDRGCADSQARRDTPMAAGVLRETDKEIGEAHIVHQPERLTATSIPECSGPSIHVCRGHVEGYPSSGE